MLFFSLFFFLKQIKHSLSARRDQRARCPQSSALLPHDCVRALSMDDIPVHVICTLFCVPCVMFVMISVSAGGGGEGEGSRCI